MPIVCQLYGASSHRSFEIGQFYSCESIYPTSLSQKPRHRIPPRSFRLPVAYRFLKITYHNFAVVSDSVWLVDRRLATIPCIIPKMKFFMTAVATVAATFLRSGVESQVIFTMKDGREVNVDKDMDIAMAKSLEGEKLVCAGRLSSSHCSSC